MKVLVSGFAPFDGAHHNPSQELVRWLETKNFDFELVTTVLPVAFAKAFEELRSIIDWERPHLVVLTGQAANREVLTVERLGINWQDARIPDNAGNQPKNELIKPKGPDAVFTRWPLAELVEHLANSGHALKISTNAGEYVCNEVLYRTLVAYPRLPVGFFHLRDESMFEALEQAIRYLALHIKT